MSKPAPVEGKTLYVRRNLLNADRFVAWAKAAGYPTTLPPEEIHVTVCYSKGLVDWAKFSPDTQGMIVKGGDRTVRPLGGDGAVVLGFSSDALTQRNAAFREDGATWDHPSYQPHVTITYKGEGVDPTKVEPFAEDLHFGPEVFEEIKEGWADNLRESFLEFLASLPDRIPVERGFLSVSGPFLSDGKGLLEIAAVGIPDAKCRWLPMLRMMESVYQTSVDIRVGGDDEPCRKGLLNFDLEMRRRDASMVSLRESVQETFGVGKKEGAADLRDAVTATLTEFDLVQGYVSIKESVPADLESSLPGIGDKIREWARRIKDAATECWLYDLVLVPSTGETMREALQSHPVDHYFVIREHKAVDLGKEQPAVTPSEERAWAIIVSNPETGENRAKKVTVETPVQAIRRTKQEARRLRNPKTVVIGGEAIGKNAQGEDVYRQTQAFSYVAGPDDVHPDVPMKSAESVSVSSGILPVTDALPVSAPRRHIKIHRDQSGRITGAEIVED